MQAVYVIDALRTPIGKFAGSLSKVRPDDLAAMVIQGLLKRNSKIDHEDIEEVILGAANQAGEDNRNVARMALLLAKLPVTVAGTTVNRLCASGLQAIVDATRAISHGEGEVYLAGGVESMTRAPFVMSKNDQAFGRNVEVFDTSIGWRFVNPALSALYHPYSMGETAENIASQWGITREAQDEFAYQSQLKYESAHQKARFANEILPLTIASGKGQFVEFAKDEHPRLSTVDQLAQLKPAFKKDGTVTAGNSSGLNDGAACVILASETYVKRHNLNPLARVASMASAGVDPSIMGIGPVPASHKALKRAGLKVKDLGLIELNEAFASQSLACIRDLDLDPALVNVNGGSIALGHPLGCSGARISATLLHEMQKRTEVKYGLATMCIGVGQGLAVIYERC